MSHVIVLGAGVTGITTAWFLRQAGHEVTVVDRQPGAGLETSYANGGQISVSHAEPWANPGAPWKVLKWLAREDAPLLFRLRPDLNQWLWGLSFLRECTPARTRHNIRQIVNLGMYSRATLQKLRAQTGLQYDALQRGILHFYTSQAEFDAAQEPARVMREHGCELDMKTADECVAIEPALAQSRDRIVGGSMTPSDESGDAHRFTQGLARRCAEAGVVFRYDALAAEDDTAPVTSIMKPLKVVPESMNVENLMTQLMQERQHMCLVYDEFGNWRGLVTLEDIMETIIGKPILDETDDIPNMRRFAKRRWEHRIKAIREE